MNFDITVNMVMYALYEYLCNEEVRIINNYCFIQCLMNVCSEENGWMNLDSAIYNVDECVK